MNRNSIKLRTLTILREMVESDIEELGPVMDDYDGGLMAGYEKCLDNIKMYESIINYTKAHASQEEPGMDY